VTDGQTDGRTDRQTEFSSLDRVCIPCSAVKNAYSVHAEVEVHELFGGWWVMIDCSNLHEFLLMDDFGNCAALHLRSPVPLVILGFSDQADRMDSQWSKAPNFSTVNWAVPGWIMVIHLFGSAHIFSESQNFRMVLRVAWCDLCQFSGKNIGQSRYQGFTKPRPRPRT